MIREAPPTPHWRILLCACPSHCAQILREAGLQQVHLHGLQISTVWPLSASDKAATVLWAILPSHSSTQAHAREQQWRAALAKMPYQGPIHMLYGHAAQQASQLQPWAAQSAPNHTKILPLEECQECLDGFSERQLFRHLQAGRSH